MVFNVLLDDGQLTISIIQKDERGRSMSVGKLNGIQYKPSKQILQTKSNSVSTVNEQLSTISKRQLTFKVNFRNTQETLPKRPETPGYTQTKDLKYPGNTHVKDLKTQETHGPKT